MSAGVRSSFAAHLRALAAGSFFILVGLYAALFLAFGTESPFLPSFLHDRHLSESQIGLVLAAGTLVRLSIGPWIGAVADRYGTRIVLALASAGAALFGTLYLAGTTFAVLLSVSMLHSVSTASINPLCDALALAASAREKTFTYGWVRAVGSGSFVLGTFGSGILVSRFGLQSIIVASSILFAAMLPFIPALAPPAAHERADAEPILTSLRNLVSNQAFRRILLVAALIIGSQAMSDAFAVISWRAAGLSPLLIGGLLAEAVGSEILVFLLVGDILLRKLRPPVCFVLAASAGVVRWSVLALTVSPAALAGSELLQGLTFALTHLACMNVIGQIIPPQQLASAQTIYGTLTLGLASATVTLISGPLFAQFGAHAFFFMAALSLVAVPVGLSVGHRPRAGVQTA